jgi:predicted nucleotidyltransferase
MIHAHHVETIERVSAHFSAQPEVEALLLVGSLAHGFASEGSDVDIAILVSEAEYERRRAADELLFLSFDLVTYPGGYVDGKYVSRGFLDAVEARGSEPARYAFAHARVLLGDDGGLWQQLERIARYPREGKELRMRRFHAQLEAWHWYTTQAARHDNAYLLGLAVSKLSLFAGRLVLAHNELLYPFHKWFLHVLERAAYKPSGLVEAITALSRAPSAAAATALYELVRDFHPWPKDERWSAHFLRDTELSWLTAEAPIEDI